MDFLWWIDAQFWQQIYYFGMVAGVSSFIYLVSETKNILQIKTEWKDIKRKFKEEFEKQEVERQKYLERFKGD